MQTSHFNHYLNMSKKNKHKHKHAPKQQHADVSEHVATSAPEAVVEKVSTVPLTPETIIAGIVEGPIVTSHEISKWALFLVFAIGIVLGALGTSIALAMPSPQLLIADILKADETESDALEHGVVEEGVKIEESTSTPLLSPMLSFTTPVSGSASATSSINSLHIPVIIYHSVRPYTKGESKYQDLYDVTPELLDQELTYMEEHGYHAVLMRDVDAHWRSGTPLPEKPVILSFDDGWKNQYEYAFPVLQKHQMKAVFYIFTNPIDHKNAHWMSWDDVLTLDNAGMEIGGHSRTHPILTKISHDNAKLDHEILEPKKIIEERLGHPIISFAYPFGAKNESVEIAVARAGYQIARTTISGVWNDPEHRLEFHGTLSSDKITQFETLLNRP